MKNNKECPLSAFMCRMGIAQSIIAELQEYFNNHMEISPKDVQWGHVGNAAHVIEQLQEIKQFLQLPNN